MERKNTYFILEKQKNKKILAKSQNTWKCYQMAQSCMGILI